MYVIILIRLAHCLLFISTATEQARYLDRITGNKA